MSTRRTRPTRYEQQTADVDPHPLRQPAPPPRFRSREMWATVRSDDQFPVLWATRQDARDNCEPDEFVVQVSVAEVRR